MKRYKANKALFLMFPVIILSIILIYMIFLFKHSYTWINVFNLAFDAIILLYYMFHFCYEMSMDSQGINFYTIFGRRRVVNSHISKINVSSFLTRVKSDERKFYIVTTKNGSNTIIDILKDTNKTTE